MSEVKPTASPWKLFEIDGFALLAELGPNEDGDGCGVTYRLALDSAVGEVSFWVGTVSDNEKVAAHFEAAFSELDETGARAAFEKLKALAEGFVS